MNASGSNAARSSFLGMVPLLRVEFRSPVASAHENIRILTLTPENLSVRTGWISEFASHRENGTFGND